MSSGDHSRITKGNQVDKDTIEATVSAAERDKLIEDGIQTIQFIQANKPDIQKTYGRSTIQGPSTRVRTDAWEKYIGANTGGASAEARRDQISQGEDEGGCSTGDNSTGQDSTELSIYKEEITKPGQDNNHQVGDGENNNGDHKGHRKNTDSGSLQGDRGGRSGRGRVNEPEGSIRDKPAYLEDDSGLIMHSHDGQRTENDNKIVKPKDIPNATPEDIRSVLSEEAGSVHKRLSNLSVLTQIAETEHQAEPPVKKGIEGNTASVSQMEERQLESGATPAVRKSQQYRSSRSVSAGSVQSNVSNVSTTSNDDIEQDTCSSSLEEKIDKIMNDQKIIMRYLKGLGEITEEIKTLRRSIQKQALALSTVESYITDMMIIIPKFGNPNYDPNSDRNPDLRPVIGRDTTRGLKEVSKKWDAADSFDPSKKPVLQLNKEVLTEPLNFQKNNAANFVPSEDYANYMILLGIIDNEVNDKRVAQKLKELLKSQYGKLKLEDLARDIRKFIDRFREQQDACQLKK
ncbi:phosphoprotein [Wufeng Typhlomys cinereus jeilongvirus 1]|uniref:Phosphoprotein n=1 Tax=Wufeng Typhlomys cinereus jeilongvirus 1 TaxID=2928989 RepID=A0A8T9KM91_9MONO|nr:phosphoprotein [Wufeng Typhlomys cinereus jeilongvirus 1]